MKVRIITSFLCLCLCGCLISCATPTLENDGTQSKDAAKSDVTYATKENINIAYYNGDSLNPIETTSSTNFQVSKLIFDTLVTLGDNLEIKPAIAENYTYEGNNIIIKIKSGIKFHDGSSLSANDVVNTLNSVKNNQSGYYYDNLLNVSAIAAKDDLTVILTLKQKDFSQMALLDIPIVKTASDGSPVGTGRYVYSKAQNGDIILTANNDWYGGKINIKKINLISMPDADAQKYAFETGVIDAIDISPSTKIQQTYVGSWQDKTYNSTNLVYIGVNNNMPYLNKDVRRYINNAIDRSTLAYEGAEYDSMFIYGNWWKDASAYDSNGNSDLSKFIDAAGLDDTNGDKLYDTFGGVVKKEPLRLIYNSGNELRSDLALKIKNQLEKIGISVEISELPFEDYKAALNSGSFDLYLAEVKLRGNMDLSPLLSTGADLNFGAFSSQSIDDALQKIKLSASDSAYRQNISELSGLLSDQAPFIPLFLRSGTLGLSFAITGDITPKYFDIFYGIESWSINTKK